MYVWLFVLGCRFHGPYAASHGRAADGRATDGRPADGGSADGRVPDGGPTDGRVPDGRTPADGGTTDGGFLTDGGWLARYDAATYGRYDEPAAKLWAALVADKHRGRRSL